MDFAALDVSGASLPAAAPFRQHVCAVDGADEEGRHSWRLMDFAIFLMLPSRSPMKTKEHTKTLPDPIISATDRCLFFNDTTF
jgi:hypothetical protein